MNSIQEEIYKLNKLYNLDETYFILEAYKFINQILQWYFRKDVENSLNSYIANAKYKIEKNNSLELHQIKILEEIKDFCKKITVSKIDTNFQDIKSIDALSYVYELSKIFKYQNIENYLKNIFPQNIKEFITIDKIYIQKNESKFIAIDEVFNHNIQQNHNKQEFVNIKSHLDIIDENIQHCDKLINKNKFKNKFLKYDTSHLEYQKRYWALSDAQSKIIENIFSNLKGCFYIEGVAGSGKSMVLLKLFEMINEKDITATSYFLTYTNSLVRFDKNGLYETNYSKELIRNIKTIDAYFSFNLQLDFKDYKILRVQIPSKENNILISLLERAMSIYKENGGECSLSSNDAFMIIEHQIFENLYDRETCQKVYHSLDLYFISEIYKSLQLDNKVLSKAFSILCMIEAIKSKGRNGYTDYILVDESQDLTLAQIELLRISARKALILAGDVNQSIFVNKSCLVNLPFNFKHYKLNENYRNTYEIKTLADAYLDSFNDVVSLKKVVYEKKSNGLRPRLFKCGDVNSTIDLLIKKIKIDIEEFNLDLKDILIICPSNYVIKQIVDRIEYPTIYLKDRDIDFNKSSIKISTIYSSKGCGFAYVYLFIDNKIYINNSLDKAEKDTVLKRLIYVALTRSMNSLNIFIPLSKLPLKPIYNLLEIME
jgi:hypothetical protein